MYARTAMAADSSSPAPGLVLAELERVLASPSFGRAERLSRFLRFVVEQALQGQTAETKEYVIGLSVFDRGPDFDPKTDSIVRASAAKLRYKLQEYYSGEGRNNPIRIGLPKGSYTPVFHTVGQFTPHISNDGWQKPRRLLVLSLVCVGFLSGGAVVLRTVIGKRTQHSPVRSGNLRVELQNLERDARQYAQQSTAAGYEHAVKAWQNIIERAPQYAPAYVGLALSTMNLGNQIAPVSRLETELRVRGAIAKAIELDPYNSGSYLLLGRLRAEYNYDWAGAEQAFQRAIELAPSSADARHRYATFLCRIGRTRDGLAQLEAFEQTGSAAVDMRSAAVECLYYAGQLSRAAELAEEQTRLFPTDWWTWLDLGRVRTAQAKYNDAVACYERARNLGGDPENLGLVTSLVYAYGKWGRTRDARTILNSLREKAKERHVSPMILATAHLGLDEWAEATELIRAAIASRDPRIYWLRADPRYAVLRSRSEGIALLREAGFK
jgi:pentatricopeptide repeat protein